MRWFTDLYDKCLMHRFFAEKIDFATDDSSGQEKTQGDVHYLSVMKFLHAKVKPNSYLEIGVRRGNSLKIAKCSAVGVDPMPEIQHELSSSVNVFDITSDDFFKDREKYTSHNLFDFIFIDGMHLFEYVLRDFINAERLSRPGSLIVIDDIFPSHPSQANRERSTNVWTGDVWKFLNILKQYRPELRLYPINTWPTGLLLVGGLDKDSDVLSRNYEKILSDYSSISVVPDEILNRTGVYSCKDRSLFDFLNSLGRL